MSIPDPNVRRDVKQIEKRNKSKKRQKTADKTIYLDESRLQSLKKEGKLYLRHTINGEPFHVFIFGNDALKDQFNSKITQIKGDDSDGKK